MIEGSSEIPLSVVLPTTEVGGHEHMLLEWLLRARQLGLRPTFYCRPNLDLSMLAEKLGFTVNPIQFVVHESGPRWSARWRDFLATVRTASRVPRGSAVLLAPGCMQAGLLPMFACLLAQQPVVCYVPMAFGAKAMRYSWPKLRDWLTARFAKHVRMWITITDDQRDRIIRHWNVRAPVHVIPNRIRELSSSPVRREPGESQQRRLRILFAGRFDPNQKGLDWLAAEIAAHPEWASGFAFVFQGRGPFQADLEALQRQMGPECVEVLAWGEISETLERVDVVLLTSRFEGFPLIAIQAIWAGAAVVATVESGLTDVLPPSCLFNFGDSAGLRAALGRMRDMEYVKAVLAHATERIRSLLDEKKYDAAISAAIKGIAAAAER